MLGFVLVWFFPGCIIFNFFFSSWVVWISSCIFKCLFLLYGGRGKREEVEATFSLLLELNLMTAVPTIFFCVYMQPGAMGGEEVKVFTKCFVCWIVGEINLVFLWCYQFLHYLVGQLLHINQSHILPLQNSSLLTAS